MYYMDGFLEGLPKVLKSLSYDFLKEQECYFIRVKIIKLHKQLDFPLTSKVDEDGVRNFTNNMDNEIIFDDKASLEDLIKFQKSEFIITNGCYSNEGRNENINHAIGDLCNSRLKLKKDKNPAQVVIKMLMNSMYGKTITKPIETDTVIKDSQHDFEKYVSLKYNCIDSALEVNGRYYIKTIVTNYVSL